MRPLASVLDRGHAGSSTGRAEAVPLRAGVQVRASSSEASSETVMVMASARKKLPVTPATEMRGRKTTMGVMVEPMRGAVISCSALRMASTAAFAGVAVKDDVFDDDDGVVDDQADGGGEAAQGHEVEAFAEDVEEDEGDGDGGGNDQAGDERGAPVAKKDDDDDGGEDEADEDGVAHAGDAFADEFGLIVVGLEGRRRAGAWCWRRSTSAATSSAT